MKKEIIVLLGALFTLLTGSLEVAAKPNLRAQAEEEDFLGGDVEEGIDEEPVKSEKEEDTAKRQKELEEAERKRKEEEAALKQKDEAKKAEEAKRAAIKARQIKERKAAEAKAKDLDALREAVADTSEYALNPSSVELVVEMDPNGYGFRTRAHRMSMAGEFDLILRGRGILHYDYRFFNYLSFGLLAGVDWSDISLFSRFRDQLSKPSPKQFSMLGGISAKWRLTEWYMRSSVFLEPSVIFGHMWQTLVNQETTFWRLRPGIFGGIETVFDSGLSTTLRVGVEFPFDFGGVNPIKEAAEPLFLVGFGFAI